MKQPDTAFTSNMRKKIRYNVSLNLPIIRTSVDHGTAYDIAYKDKNPSTLSKFGFLY
jgi:hypothetical protein